MATLSFEEFAGTVPQTLSFEEFAAGGPIVGDTAVEEIGQNILEVSKGVIPGAVQFGGTVLKGVAAGKVSVERYEIEAADVLRRVLAMSPAELSRARSDVRRNLGTFRGGFFDRALSEVMAGEDPEAVIRANYPETIGAEPRVAESSIYQAGEAVGEFGRELIPAAPGYEQSIGRQLGEGLGSMAAGAATSLVLGPAGAASAFMFAGSGEAVERAIQAGATEEQIIEAARLGHYPGLTDTIPVEVWQRG